MRFDSLTLRAFGPAMPHAQPVEAVRDAVGALLGLGLTQAVLWLIASDLGLDLGSSLAGAGFWAHPMLIAPLGASAVMIYLIPASPMSQPWSVVAGNTLSAALALAILPLVGLILGGPPVMTLIVAVFAAILVMAWARCLHPPGGAVAIATVLAAPAGLQGSLTWLGLTVFAGSALLVAFGLVFHRVTGRRYPFAPLPVADEPAVAEPLSMPPSPLVLAAALAQLRLEGTVGVDDLARLITTAEALAPHPKLTAAQIMTRDPATLSPTADWRQISALFVRQGCRALPVVDGLNRLLGLVPVLVILRPGAQGLSAHHLMQATVATASLDALLADLLPALLQGQQTCLPVLDADGSLCGVITRSDILAALVHASETSHEGPSDDHA